MARPKKSRALIVAKTDKERIAELNEKLTTAENAASLQRARVRVLEQKLKKVAQLLEEKRIEPPLEVFISVRSQKEEPKVRTEWREWEPDDEAAENLK